MPNAMKPLLPRTVSFALLFIALHAAAAQVWSSNDFAPYSLSVASSANGGKLLAACGDGDVWTSIDAGATWLHHTNLVNATMAACSADGNILFARGGGGFAVST